MKLVPTCTLAEVMLALFSGTVGAQITGVELTLDREWNPDSPVGTAAAYHLDSQLLGETRRVFVALPASHGTTSRQYPLLLVLDGESIFGPVAAAAATLAEAGHVPEMVLVGIENTDRLRDLSPPGLPVSGNDGEGRADVFLSFLQDELHPALRAAFRGGGPITLVGHSSGGLFAHYAAGTAPQHFGSVLALDAPMHLEDGKATQPLVSLAKRGAGPLTLVTLETRFGWPAKSWAELTAAAPRTWLLARETVDDETHQSMVWPSAYRGLKLLFQVYSTVGDRLDPGEVRLARFDSMNTLGPTAPPPASLLGEVVRDQVDRRDIAEALNTLERLRGAYGTTGQHDALQRSIETAGEERLDGPTLEQMAATPRPSPAAVAELIGAWTGSTWLEGNSSRRPLHLSVQVVDGVPVGEFSFGEGPTSTVEYMNVVDGQIHLGYMNRMRPRGMLMYEGTIRDHSFQGRFVLRGVVFRTPDGRTLPEMRFDLERVRP